MLQRGGLIFDFFFPGGLTHMKRFNVGGKIRFNRCQKKCVYISIIYVLSMGFCYFLFSVIHAFFLCNMFCIFFVSVSFLHL